MTTSLKHLETHAAGRLPVFKPGREIFRTGKVEK